VLSVTSGANLKTCRGRTNLICVFCEKLGHCIHIFQTVVYLKTKEESIKIQDPKAPVSAFHFWSSASCEDVSWFQLALPANSTWFFSVSWLHCCITFVVVSLFWFAFCWPLDPGFLMLSSLVFRYTNCWKMCMQCPSFSQNTQIRLVLPLQVLDLLQRSLTTLSPPHSCGGCCTASTVCFLSHGICLGV